MKFTALLGLSLASFAVAQSSESLGPAPTESYGCEPHGDHYHCEGHVSETAAPTAAPTGDDHDEDEHDHDHDHDEEHDHDHDHDHDHEHGDKTETPTASVTVTESLPPSPTASGDCEPHGDHWHCDGGDDADDGEDSDEATTTSEDGAEPTSGVAAQLIPLAGAMAAAVLAF